MCVGRVRVGGGNGTVALNPGKCKVEKRKWGEKEEKEGVEAEGVKRFLGQRLTFSRTITINNWRVDFHICIDGGRRLEKGEI